MSPRNHYYYDSEKCEFIPVEYNRFDFVIYTACLWILNGLILGAAGLTLLSSYVGTPAELALKSENEMLHRQFQMTRESILSLEDQMASIVEMDNEMYRSMLGLDPISPDERTYGTGGTDPYSEFDLYGSRTSEILRWTAGRLENLERRLTVQKVSFEEIQGYYNENQELLRHLPAIKPVNGMLLSGFGMRMHPVLRYRRMHEGVDFRAETGTPVYATGDGVISMSGRRGSYGLMLSIDHGHGYETRYAHLSSFADDIRQGVEVQRGDLIGYSGSTGMTQGPHLHYEVRINGEPVDPLNYLIADTTPEEYQMFQEIARSNPVSMD